MRKPKPATAGRPMRTGAPTHGYTIRITDAEELLWRDLAKRAGAKDLSAWIRARCNGGK